MRRVAPDRPFGRRPAGPAGAVRRWWGCRRQAALPLLGWRDVALMPERDVARPAPPRWRREPCARARSGSPRAPVALQWPAACRRPRTALGSPLNCTLQMAVLGRHPGLARSVREAAPGRRWRRTGVAREISVGNQLRAPESLRDRSRPWGRGRARPRTLSARSGGGPAVRRGLVELNVAGQFESRSWWARRGPVAAARWRRALVLERAARAVPVGWTRIRSDALSLDRQRVKQIRELRWRNLASPECLGHLVGR